MEAATTPQSQAAPPPRLRERYEQDVAPALTKKFGYTSAMQIPRLQSRSTPCPPMYSSATSRKSMRSPPS